VEVIIARHGETEWSRDRRHTGLTDIPLTDTGREQARALAPTLAGRSFAAVLSSPLSRAAETCRLAGLEPELDGDLVEWDYGDYEGITTDEIRRERPDWVLWRDGCPSGEQAAAVGARVDRVIERIRGLDVDVAVFAHGHILRVLAARWIELGPEAGALLALDTATLSTLGYERETPVVKRWNVAAGPRPDAPIGPSRASSAR